MIPPEIMMEHRAAAELAEKGQVNTVGATLIIAIWFLPAVDAGGIAYRFVQP